jgi:large repetitive protein
MTFFEAANPAMRRLHRPLSTAIYTMTPLIRAFLFCFCSILLWVASLSVHAQQIEITSPPITACEGDSIRVEIRIGGIFPPNNQFFLELSDSTGSFDDNLPLEPRVSIPPGTTTFPIVARLALDATRKAGNRYRIRARSTNPNLISTNTVSIQIRPSFRLDVNVITAVSCTSRTAIVTIDPPANQFRSWILNGRTIVEKADISHVFTGLIVGDYHLLVENRQTGCSAEARFTIEIAGRPTLQAELLSKTDPTTCIDDDGTVSVSIQNASNGVSYYVSLGATNPYVSGPHGGATNLTIRGLAQGRNMILLVDQAGCRDSFFVNMVIDNTAAITAISNSRKACGDNPDGEIGFEVEGKGDIALYEVSCADPRFRERLGSIYRAGQTIVRPNFSAGTYCFIIIDSAGCESPVETVVVEKAELIVLQTPIIAFDCSTNLASVVLMTTIPGNYEYSFDSRGFTNTNTFEGLTPGRYSYAVREVGSPDECATQGIVDIEALDRPEILGIDSASLSLPCAGDSNGSISIRATGGSGQLRYFYREINSPITVDNFTGDFAGLPGKTVYLIWVEDENGCRSEPPFAFTLDNHPPFNVNIERNPPVLCITNTNNTATIVVNGINPGNAPYIYALDGGSFSTINRFPNLAGNRPYRISTMDQFGCIRTDTVLIPFAPPIVIGQPTIVTRCDADVPYHEMIVNATGTEPLRYSLTNNNDFQLADTFSLRSSAPITIYVRDSFGCIERRDFTPPALPDTLAFQLVGNSPNCPGQTTGEVQLFIQNGTPPFEIFENGTVIVRRVDGNGSEYRFGQKSGGMTYSYTVEDAIGCRLTKEVPIISPTALELRLIGRKDIDCHGQRGGRIELEGNGPDSSLIQLFRLGESRSLQESTNGTLRFTLELLVAGTYAFVLVDNETGCADTLVETLTQPEEIDFDPVVTNASCGRDNGQIKITNLKGITNNGTFSVELRFGTSTGTRFANQLIFNNLPSSNNTPYRLTVTNDENGCKKDKGLITVRNIRQVFLDSLSIERPCEGAGDGAIRVHARCVGDSCTPLLYQINGSAWQSSPDFPNLFPDTYTVRVRDTVSDPQRSCQQETTINLTKHDTIRFLGIAVLDSIPCDNSRGATIRLHIDSTSGAGGPFRYKLFFANGDEREVLNTVIENITDSISTILITDTAGCFSAQEPKFTIPRAVPLRTALAIVKNPTCAAGGEVRLTVLNGRPPFSYRLDGVEVESSRAFNYLFQNVPAGRRFFTVVDSNGCAAPALSEDFKASLALRIDEIRQPTCALPGEVRIVITTGAKPFIFSWNGETKKPTPVNDTTYTLTGLSGGRHTLVVTDDNQCTQTQTIELDNVRTIVLESTTVSRTCANLSNGSVSLNVAGANGRTLRYERYQVGSTVADSTNATGRFTGMAAGRYRFTIIDPLDITCNISTDVTLETFPAIVYTLDTSNVSCAGKFDGRIRIDVSSGESPFIYSRDSGATFVSNPEFENLPADTFYLVIQDKHVCKVDTPVILAVPNDFRITLTDSAGVSCAGRDDGFIAVSVEGGQPPFRYLLNNLPIEPVAQRTYRFGNLNLSSYTVSVLDANDCQAQPELRLLLTVPESLTVSYDIIQANCGRANDGAIRISAKGGRKPYRYRLNGGAWQTDTAFTNLLPNTDYRFEVQDDRNCSYTSGNIQIGLKASSIDFQVHRRQAASCARASNGQLIIPPNSVRGGTGPYQFKIVGRGDFSPSGTFDNLRAGTYQMVVRDANGCESNPIPGVVGLRADSVQFTTDTIATHPTCLGVNDGRITVRASGGDMPYSYAIPELTRSNPDGIFDQLPAGLLNLIVQDANGCADTLPVTLTPRPLNLIYSVQTIEQPRCTTENGHLRVVVTAGVGPYQYSKDNGVSFQDAADFTNLAAGRYLFRVKNGIGCVSESLAYDLAAIQHRITFSDTATTHPTCLGASNGGFSYQFQADRGIDTFLLNGKEVSPGELLGLGAGKYMLTAIDGFGCRDSIAFELLPKQSPFSDVELTIEQQPECKGVANGSVFLQVTGGSAPLRFSIDNGDNYQDSPRFSQLPAGTYRVWVRDVDRCRASDEAVLIHRKDLVATHRVLTLPSCGNAANGEVEILVSGQTDILRYELASAPGLVPDPIFRNLRAGNFIAYVVEDNTQCRDTVAFTLGTGNSGLNYGLAFNAPSCVGLNNGSITVEGSGGQAPIRYQLVGRTTWAETGLFIGLAPGQYKIMVRDANGCDTLLRATLAPADSLRYAAQIVTNPTCAASSDGAVRLTGTGGVAPLQYQDINSARQYTTADIESIGAGTYVFRVRDARGCVDTTAVVRLDGLVYRAGADTVLCVSNTGAGSSQRLNLSGRGTPAGGSWVGQFIENGTAFRYDANTPAGIYMITYGPALAVCRDSMTIAVVQVRVLARDSICQGQTRFSLPEVNPTGGTWVSRTPSLSVAGNSVQLPADLAPASYLFSYRTGSCEASFSLTVLPTPKAAITADFAFNSFVVGEPVTLQSTSTIEPAGEALQHEWLLEGTELTGERVVYAFTQTGSHAISYRVSTVAGCADTLLQPVEVLESIPVAMDNVFTPNGDGANDFFPGRNFFPPNVRASMKIYTRTGQLVYANDNGQQPLWDGSLNGSPLDTGVYFYAIDITDTVLNRTMRRSGSVTLLR